MSFRVCYSVKVNSWSIAGQVGRLCPGQGSGPFLSLSLKPGSVCLFLDKALFYSPVWL